MGKYKIEHHAGQTLLVIQSQKGQQISEREYYAIHTGQVSGLLRADVVRKGNTFRLCYNISGFISLREFLVNPLNKRSFGRLLSNILHNLQALQKAYFTHQFILMDLNAAMVNPTTQEVSFVYVPVAFYESETNLKEFLLSIIKCCSFVPGENTDYVREYIRILNSGINFSVFDLEEYIKTLGTDTDTVEKKCRKCGTLLPDGVLFCSACGMKVGGLHQMPANGVYEPLSRIAPPQPVPQPAPQPAPQPVPQPVPQPAPQPVPQPVPQPSYSDTIAGTQLDAASLAGGASAPVVRKAYLRRLKTGEQLPIISQVFRIGKDPYNTEYCIADNTTISRQHAQITCRDNRWFLKDLNSTNKTYIDDRAIYPNMDVEIYDGLIFVLANESFMFNLY